MKYYNLIHKENKAKKNKINRCYIGANIFTCMQILIFDYPKPRRKRP